jgi:hypothetical protein
MHRRTTFVALVFVGSLLIGSPASAFSSQERPDPAERLTELTERIDELDEAEASLRTKIDDSREAAADAEEAAAAAADRVEDLDAEMTLIEDRLRERAVSAYTGQFDSLEASVFDDDPLVALDRKVLLEVVQADDAELEAMLEEVRDDLSAQRRRSERRQRQAKALETELLGQLDDLKVLRSELDDQAAELKRLVEAKRPAGTTIAGSDLCEASGIVVACEIADDVNEMVAEARSDGLVLTGGGYRDPAKQIELRKEHCGTSQAAIYTMAASACSPPTARPGTSQHEIGMAIDFANCSTRQTACYRWLAVNAERFGFFNLPSEAWHWSRTGA